MAAGLPPGWCGSCVSPVMPPPCSTAGSTLGPARSNQALGPGPVEPGPPSNLGRPKISNLGRPTTWWPLVAPGRSTSMTGRPLASLRPQRLRSQQSLSTPGLPSVTEARSSRLTPGAGTFRGAQRADCRQPGRTGSLQIARGVAHGLWTPRRRSGEFSGGVLRLGCHCLPRPDRASSWPVSRRGGSTQAPGHNGAPTRPDPSKPASDGRRPLRAFVLALPYPRRKERSCL